MTGKYDHLFVEHMQNCADDMVNEGAEAGLPEPPNVQEGYALMRAADVPESKIYMTYVWITESSTPAKWVTEHVHDYDEILSWTGNDPTNAHDLGAEIYFDIEGERHTVTTSGSVYIPAGTRHCPLGFNRVDRPFTFSALLLNSQYITKPVT